MTITELLQEHGVEFREAGESPHVTQGWLGIECPWCGKGTGKFGCGISLQWGNVSCWKCGTHKLFDTLAELTGKPWRELRRGFDFQFGGEGERKEPAGILAMPTGLGPLGRYHREYLRGRGFDPDHLEQFWGLKGIGVHSHLAWRVWIPIHWRGEVVSWTTRAIHPDNTVRYRAARPEEEKLPAKQLLYGLDHTSHAGIVCEGPADAWRIGPGAVAVLGTGYSRTQLLLLSRLPSRVVCFDSNREAQQRARKLCDALAPFPGRTQRVELDAADPGSASPKEITLLRKAFL